MEQLKIQVWVSQMTVLLTTIFTVIKQVAALRMGAALAKGSNAQTQKDELELEVTQEQLRADLERALLDMKRRCGVSGYDEAAALLVDVQGRLEQAQVYFQRWLRHRALLELTVAPHALQTLYDPVDGNECSREELELLCHRDQVVHQSMLKSARSLIPEDQL